MISAVEHGYYDVPVRISSRELAKKLGMRGFTLIEHRGKANIVRSRHAERALNNERAMFNCRNMDDGTSHLVGPRSKASVIQ